MKNNKLVIGIIGVVGVVLIALATTYAYWIITRNQESQNALLSACLDISLTNEANDISLTDQFPLSDEDGLKLTPYTFTVSNNCNTSIDFSINLESIGDETTSINTSAIKVAISESSESSVVPFTLSSSIETNPTLSDAYLSNTLLNATLDNKGDSKTYNLRLWIDENASIAEMKKTYTSKISVSVGQGIYNPYKLGTLAYDIVENYGGTEAIANLSSEWKESTSSTETVSIRASSNFWYATNYRLDNRTRKYILSGEMVQATLAECRAGQKSDGTIIKCGNYTLQSSVAAAESESLYRINSFTSSEKTDTSYRLYMTAQKSAFIQANNFSEISADVEDGLYSATDDYGTSYYFRGNVLNNYVKFGTYAAGTTVNGVTYESETPIYWRIIRVNGDGTIRMIYDGTTLVENGVNHDAYVGSSSSSPLNNSISVDWYNDNLNDNYGKYIANSIFCVDSGLITKANTSSWSEPNRDYRVSTTLICSENTNKTMASVGGINVDEVYMAGNSGKNYYLYTGTEFWTISEAGDYSFYTGCVGGGSSSSDERYAINSDGVLNSKDYFSGYETYTCEWTEEYGDNCYCDTITQNHEAYIRPVINLKADVEFTGNGTIDSPYEIVME